MPGLLVERHVRVYLPPDFSRNALHPTLFAFDGQNLFGDEGSFAGGWHLHDVVDALAKRRKRLPILVGVDHGREHRIAELSPWPHGSHAGVASVLIDWIADTLRPSLAREFGLDGNPSANIIGGSSLGGLAAMYAHVRRADVFGGAMCMSPAFWVDHAHILRWVAEQPLPAMSKIYIDCGGREGGGRMLALAESLATHLRQRGYGDDRLMWRPDARGMHNERAWRRRAPKALRFLFPARKPPRTKRRAVSLHPMAEPEIW